MGDIGFFVINVELLGLTGFFSSDEELISFLLHDT